MVKSVTQKQQQYPPFSIEWGVQQNEKTSAWFSQPKQMQTRQRFVNQLRQLATARAESEREGAESADWRGWVAEAVVVPQTDLEQRQLRRRSAQHTILEEGERLQDVYPSGIAWLPDRTGFFYDRYLAFPGAHGLYFHLVGTAQRVDVCVYYNAAASDWYYQPSVSANGRFLLLTILHKGATNRLTLFSLNDKGEVGQAADIIATFCGRYDLLHWTADHLVVRALEPTAPNGRLIRIDLAAPHHIHTILQFPDTHLLVDAVPTSTGWIVNTLHGGASQLHQLDKNGNFGQQIPLPGFGTVTQLTSNAQTESITFSYSDFSQPETQYSWNTDDGLLSMAIVGEKRPFNPIDFVTQQIWIPSADGTQIPLFIGYHRQLSPRNRPTLLNAYGGLGVPFTPHFTAEGLAWMIQGGIWAVVCARGGGELGAAWHQAGVGANKQNTFDDVLAASHWLCAENITSASRLGLWGGSNGGLTAAACLTQNPMQFGAVLIESGLLDMLNYHHLGRGADWIPEYGSPDNAAERAILTSYSPLHNVHADTPYPATLISSYEEDRRVGESHSCRFAAAMQAATSGTDPILLRVATGAGHIHNGTAESWQNRVVDALTFFATELNDDQI